MMPVTILDDTFSANRTIPTTVGGAPLNTTVGPVGQWNDPWIDVQGNAKGAGSCWTSPGIAADPGPDWPSAVIDPAAIHRCEGSARRRSPGA